MTARLKNIILLLIVVVAFTACTKDQELLNATNGTGNTESLMIQKKAGYKINTSSTESTDESGSGITDDDDDENDDDSSSRNKKKK